MKMYDEPFKRDHFIGKSILSMEKEDLVKLIIEYTAKEQDYKTQNKLFKNLIKNYATLSIKLKETIEKVTYLAIMDPLTQVYNRVKFNEELLRQEHLFRRVSSPFSLLMFDIDHFKNVNDTFGHDNGDMVLKTLCNIVKASIREIDIFARWGGEEFMLILSGDNINNAMKTAERIRREIEEYKFETVGKVTCSFGVTEFLKEDAGIDLIKRADNALYMAKHKGRNCVVNL